MLKFLLIVLLDILMLSSFDVHAQTKRLDSFHIYVLKYRYDSLINKSLDSLPLFRDIKILFNYQIESRNKNETDFKKLSSSIKEMFPNENDTALLCIDIENKYYSNLKNYEVGSSGYDSSVTKFKDLIEYIKLLRPNIKIGIYGLPFRVYFPSQLKYNRHKKLDPILSLCDYLFPSLYIMYPDSQRGRSANIAYLQKNLNISFSYAIRLHKRVIPFVWYIVHPSNSKFGYNLIEPEQMKVYIDYIKNFLSQTRKQVSGIVWWDTPSPFNKNLVRIGKNYGRLNPKDINSSLFFKYMEYLKYLPLNH